ncbi:MAG: hypothetical protein A2312_00870 [Candidatus Staskawiczbacteria bacterium RIFOXYB2_FULL_32_9]|uniref:Uncharacterized protein n=1 Tax=Candidatus Staskawiczbacteria bacterium RIFOXYD1_FULL_32_13 TaxID=1802234 RepID=A0A1G2JN06_9BACT|nr:MAG: hypothetical protein UR22_C0001G0044 [Parcubacteria group bacterium GW2011_GWC2_32_10]OGZ78250.1 MAG: hypothetical protein A2360_03705 [Candidatus Staskawiczbacteria bacterium RIFOXYB1_FULL_32_11]OGZ84465.1 MAG: hypothetical protein A2312_00870 [Candidatus Staskawiczbacteria bacterium RIFOXYB2_FULL_32_9]OGZ85142.1 MAG: hypothetical protein A2463_00015 [Candidatus Staskawiczbacteria bacterium RIFOXYC2_FULL_32_10]OGZ87680.1 MAG: hypothetical protein A2561_03225 [Candidatus Staskawiczbacte
MNKKVLVISLVVLIIILVMGVFVFFNLKDVKAPVSNFVSEINNPENGISNNVEQKVEDPKIEIGIPEIETENGKNPPGLQICVDVCGDGVCQPVGTICKDNLNCPCEETKEYCPQDCR